MTAFRNSVKMKQKRVSLRLAIKIIRHGDIRNRVFAVIGITALFLKKDIEGLYKAKN